MCGGIPKTWVSGRSGDRPLRFVRVAVLFIKTYGTARRPFPMIDSGNVMIYRGSTITKPFCRGSSPTFVYFESGAVCRAFGRVQRSFPVFFHGLSGAADRRGILCQRPVWGKKRESSRRGKQCAFCKFTQKSSCFFFFFYAIMIECNTMHKEMEEYE